MSPAAITLVVLAAVYLLGRFAQHNATHTLAALDDDVAMDTWAAIWNEAYAEDELERWARLPTRDHGTIA